MKAECQPEEADFCQHMLSDVQQKELSKLSKIQSTISPLLGNQSSLFYILPDNN